MSEFEVSNYGIYDSAISSIKQLNSSLSSKQEQINESKSSLKNEAVFMGPICDSCVDGFNTADQKIQTISSNYSKIESYLLDVSSNYKDKDAEVSKFLSFDSSTGLLTTSNSSLGNTQASSFFELGDRAYNGDSAAQQEWIEKVAKIVDSSQYSKYGLKNSLLIAQIINESGWMHTPNSHNDDGSTLSGNNNILGINTDMDISIDRQDSAWSKKRKSTQSNVTQWEDGEVVDSSEGMRTYDSIEECIEDYANVLYLYHPECKGSNNLEDYRTFLDHYTPNPNQSTTDYYAHVISKYGLEKYDR